MSTDFALSGEQSWRILRLYHLYRLVIGLTLVLLVSSDLDTELLEMAQEAGIAVPDGAKKAEIIDLIEALKQN